MRHRKAIIVTLVVVVLLGAGAVLARTAGWWPFSTSSTSAAADPSTSDPSETATDEPSPPAGTDPATTSPTETAPPEPSEPAVTNGPDTEPTAQPTKPPGGTVNVVTTYASWAPETNGVEVGAYAATIESAGTCTLTLTSGSTVRTATLDALVDVSTMSCGGFLIPGAELSTGTWTAVVTYSSAASSGKSDPVEVVVP
ncbi:hypothetical protein [Sanguibacter antarcticus]|uniref:Uncharacterized protein n=1 Tax=Sanguibacter antarcticus TaxID=372484 RepID=A0A2A9E0Q8_9MICO|nr:hypothetical protein [Sanguibacter antarcticus]PFG32528.1 hypothetical protein ATL42_0368 [Sanguibacter antarcticus]